MSKKYIPVENKLPVGPKKKNFEDLNPHSKWSRIYYEKNPEKHQQKLKRQAERYIEKRPIIVKQKKQKKREQLLKVIKILGGKCDACEELFNPNLERSNLEIHHNYYDEKDLIKKSRYGNISSNVRDVLKMSENNMNPRMKYSLFCSECHNMETFIKQNQKKAWNIFYWIIDKKILDVDAKILKKINQLGNF